MEAENHHTGKRSRVGNGSFPSQAKIGQREQNPDEDEEDGEGKGDGGRSGLCPWNQQSSRISRATGGKDRHSKVYTAKGLRDRRVRLSVSTAIQFYDLQDRLGYDQPSKAIEWLIKAAATSIAELPTLESSFPDPPKPHPGVEKFEIEHEVEPGNGSQQQHCSSASETSKGSILYLSRSESRVKARERARERAAKDKEKDQEDAHHQSVNRSFNSQSSFTELLTGSSCNGTAVTTAQMSSSANCIQKQIRYLPVTAMADYFSQAGLFGQAQKSHQQPLGFVSQAHIGNSSPMGVVPFNIAVAATAAAAEDHPELQQFSFLQDHPVPIPAAADYNLNFSVPSCLAGFNRGTLQSNSPSQLPHHQFHHHYHHHLQKFSSPVDGSNLPFFVGAAPSTAAATSDVNHFPSGFDGRLQLYYGEEHRHSELKGKGNS